MDIMEQLAKRHSFYEINNKIALKEEEISDSIKTALKLYPSPFNSQSARLLVLYNKEHQKFWQLVEKELLKSAPKEKAASISERINSFYVGFGTILYFLDTNIIKTQEKQMPLYAKNFNTWAHHSNAMLQYMIWTSFANNHIGASLQHYNPLINEAVQKNFDIPKNWELIAQMPFGGIVNTPQAHSFENIEEKIVIKG